MYLKKKPNANKINKLKEYTFYKEQKKFVWISEYTKRIILICIFAAFLLCWFVPFDFE